MTQNEARDALLAGALGGNSVYITVVREQLVLALGGEQPEPPSVDEPEPAPEPADV